MDKQNNELKLFRDHRIEKWLVNFMFLNYNRAMSLTEINGSLSTNEIKNSASIDEETCFLKDERLSPYLNELKELESGRKLIERLKGLGNCELKLVINDKSLEGYSFENTIAISEISDNKIEMTLPPYNPACMVSIPILCKKGDSFCVQDVQVPAFIAVGHELVHFIHKAEAFNNLRLEHSDFTVTEDDIQKINNWDSHRANCRAIATLYGYDHQKDGFSEDEEGIYMEGGLFELSINKGEEWEYNKNFEYAWGGTKAYEELRTITGKESNSLSPGICGEFKFESSELDFSERHLLCDYFAKNKLTSTSMLETNGNKPFITRWTHALKAEEVQENFNLAKHLFTQEEINRLPSLKS